MRTRLHLALAFGLAGCFAPQSPDRGAYLGDGAAFADFDVHTDAAEPSTVELVFPAGADGVPQGTHHPALVLLPADDVDFASYRGLGQALARRGFVVAIPELSDDVISDAERATAARDLLRSGRGLAKNLANGDQVILTGHQDAAAVAAAQTIGGPFQGLALLFGDAKSVQLAKVPVASLVLAGTSACQLGPGALRSAWSQLPSPSAFVQLTGASEDGLSDSSGDCAPQLSRAEEQAAVADVLADYFDYQLAIDPRGLSELSADTRLAVDVK